MPLDQTHQHSSADVMQAGNPHTPIEGGSGSTQIVSVNLVFDTPDLYDAGVPFVEIMAGSVILGFFADVQTPFDDDGFLQLVDDANANAALQIKIDSTALVDVNGAFRKLPSTASNVAAFYPVGIVVVSDDTSARLWFGSNIHQPTTGAATIYAVIVGMS